LSAALTRRATGSGAPLAFDGTECRRALAALADPAHAVQLFAMPTFRHFNAPGADLDALSSWAAAASAAGNQLYLALNPVPRGWDKRANAGCVVSRRWLLVDVDPAKPPDHKDDSATDPEKRDAEMLGDQIRDYLYRLGWHLPLRIDSGNGNYLLYRLDLANDRLSRLLLRNLLHALAGRFDGALGHVGKECSNADRLAKLPGSTAAKGPHTPERPHRPCRIVRLPQHLPVITGEQIREATAKLLGKPKVTAKVPPASPDDRARALAALAGLGNARSVDYQEWLEVGMALHDVADDLCGDWDRWSRGCLEKYEEGACAAKWATFTRGGGIGLGSLIHWAQEGGWRPPRPATGPPSACDGGPGDNGRASASAGVPADELIIVRASTILPRKVEWLWPRRIPLGKLTTFAGVGGIGKTFVLCDVAARVSGGLGWPDGAAAAAPAQVLFLSGEDEPDDTLVPRLIECGADLAKVCFLKAEVQDRFTLADLATLDRALAESGGGVRFVAIDPPTAYLGGVDDHKNADLRGLLSPLKNWAARHKLALVFNTHFNKAQGKVPAMMRVMASVAWVNAVRAAHMFARDPDNEDRSLFIPMKMNLARRQKGLAFQIAELPDDRAKVEWLGEVDLTADEAANAASGARLRAEDAAAWLVERFREKLEWPSDDLFARARIDNISRNAVFEAKHKLALPKAKQVVTEAGSKVFTWWVPANWPALSQETTNRDSGTMGHCDVASF
jgi:hypothetical protein